MNKESKSIKEHLAIAGKFYNNAIHWNKQGNKEMMQAELLWAKQQIHLIELEIKHSINERV